MKGGQGLISPSKANAAGPERNTCPVSSSHLMESVPPSITTWHWRGQMPSVAAATAVAKAPVPQAIVMPEPRSHTLARKVSGPV